jgi:hypothetical protein
MSKEEPRGTNDERLVEFWSGHSFNDDCPITPYDYARLIEDSIKNPGCLLTPLHIIDAVISLRREKRLTQQSYDQLRAFLAALPSAPVKRLSDGEVFELSAYPKGTIIKYSRDTQYQDVGKSSTVNWGILTQVVIGDKHRDVVWGFSERVLREGADYRIYPQKIWSNTTIGNVSHDRFHISPTSIHESLSRYNFVEVWEFGQDIRVREDAPQGILRRVLRPSTNH